MGSQINQISQISQISHIGQISQINEFSQSDQSDQTLKRLAAELAAELAAVWRGPGVPRPWRGRDCVVQNRRQNWWQNWCRPGPPQPWRDGRMAGWWSQTRGATAMA